MKKSLASAPLAVLMFCPALWSARLDKQAKKLDKELEKISMTAAVPDGRRVVNRAMAVELGVTRRQLVEERKETGFVYGQLFGAHKLARALGLSFSQIAGEMRQGLSMFDISEQHQADLKKLVAAAKRFNKRMDQALDRLPASHAELNAEVPDSYDPADDSLNADTAEFSATDIVQADNLVHHRGKHWTKAANSSSGNAASGVEGTIRLGAAAGEAKERH